MQLNKDNSTFILLSDDELIDPDQDDFKVLPTKSASPIKRKNSKSESVKKESKLLIPNKKRNSSDKPTPSKKKEKIKSEPINSFWIPRVNPSKPTAPTPQEQSIKAEGTIELCPVCGLKLSKLVVIDLKEAHINRCLDKSLSQDIKYPTEEMNDQLDQCSDKPTSKVFEEASSSLDIKTEKLKPKHINIKDESKPQSCLIKENDIKHTEENLTQSQVVIKKYMESTLMPDKEELLRRGSLIKNPDQPIVITCPDLSHQARSKLQKELPMGKKVPGTTFTVDAFNIGPVPGCRAYFLSHYHSDHYGGMGKTFSHGTVVASTITARLVQSQIGVGSEYVLALETNVLYEINGVRVTLIDANHCPGAVLFLFEVPIEGSSQYTRILHTGDFRVDDIIHLDKSSLIMSKPLDYLYLDTTYCNPSYAFPKQPDVLEASTKAAVEFIEATPLTTNFSSTLHRWGFGWLAKKPSSQRYDKLIVCGTYSIGKERIFISIARALKSKIYVTPRKRKLLLSFQDPELNALLTDDPLHAAVHVQPMGTINAKALKEYYETMKKKNNNLQQVMGVRPTGWTFSNRYAIATEVIAEAEGPVNIIPSYTSPTIKIFGVPYSEHSSYAELRRFVAAVAECRWKHCKSDLVVIPTVRPANLTYGQISDWIKGWVASVK
ncbi:DNA cross-link repair 1A protein [Entomophthora muscae]|uniref:DNA cross-link repair 1A protein n=1 Tax=Entomophthora muscae TaxID=34485 RepID=A0ACC2STJ6_9FUNG|nr:DNA cross-link repair 1A protein [Entomophthora muscae]